MGAPSVPHRRPLPPAARCPPLPCPPKLACSHWRRRFRCPCSFHVKRKGIPVGGLRGEQLAAAAAKK